MKKLFAVLFLLLLPLAPVRAQGLHGKILIVRDTSSYVPHNLERVVPTIYSGEIDWTLSIPDDLTNYDAVLLKMGPPNGFYTGKQTDTLSFSDQLSLIEYLKKGGKLYDEAQSFFLSNFNFPFDTSDDPLDTLAHYLGLEEVESDQLTDNYDDFFGVDSEFTRGLNVPHVYDPAGYDVLGTYYPLGNFIPVLFGEEAGGGEDDIFAWIPPDPSIHAVIHNALVVEYYAPFLTRVFCDYFGLCTDAVQESPPSISAISLRVVYDGPRMDLQISSDEANQLDVSNALGIIVFHSSTQAGTSLVELPSALRDGVYFARLQSESGSKVQPFAVFSR